MNASGYCCHLTERSAEAQSDSVGSPGAAERGVQELSFRPGSAHPVAWTRTASAVFDKFLLGMEWECGYSLRVPSAQEEGIKGDPTQGQTLGSVVNVK